MRFSLADSMLGVGCKMCCRIFRISAAHVFYGDLEADACRRQYLSPIGDKFTVCVSNLANFSVEIEKSDGMNFSAFFTKSDIPVNLIRQGVPGESNDRNTVVPDSQYI